MLFRSLATGVDEAGEVYLRLAVGDGDRGGGVFLFRQRARIDRIRFEMHSAIDAEYCPATGVVIDQHRANLAVHLEVADFRFWHLADIVIALSNVRCGGKADIDERQTDVCF